MRIRAALLIACVGVPAIASAQDSGGLGLDLSDDAAKKEPPKEPSNTPAPATTAPTVAPPAPAAAAAESAKKGLENVAFTERDITQEDRVKSVQRKVYLKVHRFELAPFISACINDPYYVRYGPTLHFSYFLADTLAVGIRGSYWQTLPTDDSRTAKRTFLARIFASVPFWAAMADVEWSPLYGKIAIFNSILHFDMYLIGGLGAVLTDTSIAAQNTSSSGSSSGTQQVSQQFQGGRPGGEIGGGIRFVIKDFLAANVAIIDTSYVDVPVGTTKAAAQNLVMLNAGVSIFFPFSSTGREAE